MGTQRRRRSQGDAEEADQDAPRLSPSRSRTGPPAPPPPPPPAAVRCTTNKDIWGLRRHRRPHAKPREAAAAAPLGLCRATPMAVVGGKGARRVPGGGLVVPWHGAAPPREGEVSMCHVFLLCSCFDGMAANRI
jgi:hypothetical protein